jgi:hypothetical protein
MPRTAALTLSACLAIASACGDDSTAAETDEPSYDRICDGSQDLRLAWFLSPTGGNVRTGFQFEVGFYYLYVRGDCHYWVVPYPSAGDLWIETHTGVFDDEQETALIELLRYGDWDGLLGVWPEPDSFDVAIMRVHDGHSESGIGCAGECPGAPAVVHEIRGAFKPQLQLWWETGEPSTGPIRILTTRMPDGDPIPNTIVPWTLDLDLASVAVDTEAMYCAGQSVLIDDPATAAALRAFRAEHADGLEQFSDFFVEVEPGVYYELYLRDALPFEREDGLIPQYNGTTPPC